VHDRPVEHQVVRVDQVPDHRRELEALDLVRALRFEVLFL
jgi:hypothetical protein